MSVYTRAEVEAKIAAENLEGWYFEEDGGWLRRKYSTDGWPTTLMLVNAIGYLCEAAWHHADLSLTAEFGNLGDQDRCRLGDQVRGQDGQQVGVPGRLVCQGIGKRQSHRTFLLADQQVDVGDLVAFAEQGLTNVHDDVGSHLSSLRGVIGVWSTVRVQDFSPHPDRVARQRAASCPSWLRHSISLKNNRAKAFENTDQEAISAIRSPPYNSH